MSSILNIDPQNPDVLQIEKAVGVLRNGGIVAYPTETFYALGADAGNQKAIEKIYQIKGRNFKNPIGVIIGDMTALESLTDGFQEVAALLMEKFWPGALTLVFRASPAVSTLLTADTGKIGIRVSSHPVATALAKLLAHPITATSANRSGQGEFTTAGEVVQSIGSEIDIIIDAGPTPGISGSTFIDITTSPPVVLREGAIPTSLLVPFLHSFRDH